MYARQVKHSELGILRRGDWPELVLHPSVSAHLSMHHFGGAFYAVVNGLRNHLLYEIDVTLMTDGEITNGDVECPCEVLQWTTNTAFYHYDCRGSTIALTSANGTITDWIEYSSYGRTAYRLGTNDTPFLFNGQFGVQTDPNGLLYMRARYYNPYICRFINADPSGFAGGLNFYAFCNDNPISLEDPFGLWTWGQVGSGALHFGEGVVVGAAVTAGVILAAPEIAAGGAAALVWAGVSEVAATTVATATVSGGLYAAGGYGAYNTVANTAQNAGAATVTGNWNGVAFNAGTVAGGFAVGTLPGIVGDSSGGRTLTDSLHDLMGQPPSQAPNTWDPGAILQYEVDNAYKPSLGAPGVNYWATAPTPFSSGFTATGVAGQVGTWLNPGSGQSSSTGK